MNKTNKEKMLDGELYIGFDDVLTKERQHAKHVLHTVNNLHPDDLDQRHELLRNLLGNKPKNLYIEPPFRCDYGYNIIWGEGTYANYNLTILDCNIVNIGKNVMFGPNVNIFTAGHPLDVKTRVSGLEYAYPITIGDCVWIGGGTTINPGVTIGENTVIGSGSVVTKDIPANCVAVGNPCRVIKYIENE